VSTIPTGAVEHELKLGARPGFSLPDLTDIVPGARVEAEPTLDLDATYVDTPDLQLVRNGVSLRRRTGEGAPRWTLKLPSGDTGVGLSRREIDVEDPGHVVPAELAALVTGWVRSSGLVPVAVIRSHRERSRLVDADGHDLAEIDDDEVQVIDDGEVAARFREIEVELLEHGGTELLQLVGDALVGAGAGAPDPTSKITRALGPRALVPPDLAPIDVGAGADLADVVTAALRRSVGTIVDQDHVVRLDGGSGEGDGVRRARSGVRRLRSDLQTLAPVLVEGWADDLRSRSSELAGVLGAVHGTDALVAGLLRRVGQLTADHRPVAGRLVHHLEIGRRAQVAALLGAMSEPGYVELLDELVAAASRPQLAEHVEGPASEWLPGLVRPRWRKLAKAVERLDSEPDGEALERVRSLARRARHACELAVPVVGAPAAELGERLGELQDLLGEIHDCAIAEEWLRSVAPTVADDQRLVAGELVDIMRERASELRAGWPDAWAACDRRSLSRWLG